MVSPEGPLATGEDLLSKGHCVINSPIVPVGPGEDRSGGHGVLVVGSKGPLALGENSFSKGHCVFDSPIVPVGPSEDRSGADGVGMIHARITFEV